MGASGRSERRFCGAAGQWGCGRIHSGPRFGALPVGRRYPGYGHDRDVADARSGPRDPWHGGGGKPRIWCATPRAPFRASVAVGIDARNGFVATKGWATETTVKVTDLARSFEDAGVAAIIYTDIERDGAMQGPNIAATEALARAVSIPVIASGGVSSMADLIALRDTGVIAGAISGRALYDGAIDLTAALAALRG